MIRWAVNSESFFPFFNKKDEIRKENVTSEFITSLDDENFWLHLFPFQKKEHNNKWKEGINEYYLSYRVSH